MDCKRKQCNNYSWCRVAPEDVDDCEEFITKAEVEALSKDADRNMIGDDVDYGLEDIGCK